MSRDLIVRNNRLIKKPLSVNDLIYGSTYAYGTLDEYDRMVEFDKIGDGPVVVYDRDHIGRGVQIEELSKKQVKLSLPLPATTYDINVLIISPDGRQNSGGITLLLTLTGRTV